MLTNRSVPVSTILPHVVYPDVEKAIEWLEKAFGFTECYRYGAPGAISGAQARLGLAWIMVKRAHEGSKTPAQLGYGTQSLTIFLDDVEAHCLRAKAAGAKILEEPHETEYGEFQYAAQDFAGHHWLFSRHARDMSPDAWGAEVFDRTNRLALLPRPRLCYLEIPAKDVHQSASFYEHVFGWNIRHHESDRPSFDDAVGDVSGAWVIGREIVTKPGLLPYIWVDSIDATLAKVAANGGAVFEAPQPDEPGGTFWFATFRDPAGNVLGLYQEGSRS